MANIRRYENAPLWDPFEMMRELFEGQREPQRAVQTFVPQFEVKETGDGYTFKADLPGVEEKDLDINLAGNRLTVSGKREAENRKEGETFYAYERSFGSFSRTFTLPKDVDESHIDAALKNGVLTLHLPKRAELQPKKISLSKGGGEGKAKA